MLKNLLISLVFILIQQINFAQTTYYIAATGLDSNPGTIDKPWLTIGKGTGANLLPGDKVLFKGGDGFSGAMKIYWKTGTLANPITFGSYGTGNATINGSIEFWDSKGVKIENLTLKGTGGTGITIYTDKTLCDNLFFDHLDISGYTSMGFDIEGGTAGTKNIRITNCNIHNNANATFSGGSSNQDLYIGYCHIHDNSNNGIMLSSINRGVFEYNVCHNNGDVGMWVFNSDYIVMQYNESYANIGGTSDGDGFDIDGGTYNSLIQYNYSHDNQGAGLALYQDGNGISKPGFSNNTIRYNISENDGRNLNYGGISIWNGSTVAMADNYIYNNTVYIKEDVHNWSSAIKIFMTGTGGAVRTYIFNNIFITNNNRLLVDASYTSGITFQNNIYWSVNNNPRINWGGTEYNSLDAWRNATGQEKINGNPVGMYTDPLLVGPDAGVTFNDAKKLSNLFQYKLKPGSPAINKGLNSYGSVDMGVRDYFGYNNRMDASLDIGAHEFSNNTLCDNYNFANNQGFENDRTSVQAISKWGTWSNGNDDADFTEGSVNFGNFQATHWKAIPYIVWTSQIVTGLPSGTYTFKAQVRSSGGQKSSLMIAKNYGGAEIDLAIPPGGFNLLQIKDIKVTNGNCEIGFWSDANANNWINFDEVVFERQFVDAGKDVSVCAGTSTTLTASGAATYKWDNGSTMASITVSPLKTTTYWVTSTNAGCPIWAGVTVTVNYADTIHPYININNSNWSAGATGATCVDGTILMGPQPLIINGWRWSGPNSFTSTQRNINLTGIQTVQAGTYTATLTNAAGCISNQNYILSVHPLPTQPVITQSGSTLHSSSTTYNQWSNNTGNISGATAQNFTPAAGGTYYVTVSNSNGCSNKSQGYNLILTNLKENSTRPTLTIYPNPSSGKFTVNSENAVISHLTIQNILGEIVYNVETTIHGNYTFPDNILNPGVYFIHFEIDDVPLVKKIIIK
jgi:hypothetical protein